MAADGISRREETTAADGRTTLKLSEQPDANPVRGGRARSPLHVQALGHSPQKCPETRANGLMAIEWAEMSAIKLPLEQGCREDLHGCGLVAGMLCGRVNVEFGAKREIPRSRFTGGAENSSRFFPKPLKRPAGHIAWRHGVFPKPGTGLRQSATSRRAAHGDNGD